MMKLNSTPSRIAARSKSTDEAILRASVDLMSTRRCAPKWSSYRIDGAGIETNEPDELIHFYPLYLSSVRHFRICHQNKRIWEIMAQSGCRFESDLLEQSLTRFRSLDFRNTNAATISCRIGESVGASADCAGEAKVEFGWRNSEGIPGFFIYTSLLGRQVPPHLRYSFLTKAIDCLNLNDIVSLSGNETEFNVHAKEGWCLYEWETWSKKINPCFLRVGPFQSFNEAASRATAFLKIPHTKRIETLSLGFTLAPDMYESMYEQLNELANDWDVHFLGSYADNISPYASDATQSPDGRFPVFTWSSDVDPSNFFYEADIIPTSTGRYLEIHSNCGNMEKLLKEAHETTGLQFTPLKNIGAAE
jgi:hypothetical protein